MALYLIWNIFELTYSKKLSVLTHQNGFVNTGKKITAKTLLTGVVAWTCNPATIEAKFWSGVGLMSIGSNSLSIVGYIVWPTTCDSIQEEEPG